MTPTLMGRIQTRLALLATIGVIWTLLVVPILPRSDMSLRDVYIVTLSAVFLTGLIGCIIWEPLYHLAQQWRWEKDWPILFSLLVGIPEGILVNVVLESWRGPVPGTTYFLHFATTWLVVWLFANGPMRVVFLRWRYRGGRVL